MKVLVIDDEPAVRDAVRRALRMEGHDVAVATGGHEGLELVARTEPEAIVLDVLMPDLGGLEVCRRLRSAGDRTPILMLTARDAVADRVAGLDAGADDYLVKPFDLDELLARLRALARRTQPAEVETDALTIGDLVLDVAAYQARVGDRAVDLTRTEFQLMELLMRNRGRVLPRGVIYERVWGHDFGMTSNALGVYVGYLRRKLEDIGAPSVLHTVRGVGYVMRLE